MSTKIIFLALVLLGLFVLMRHKKDRAQEVDGGDTSSIISSTFAAKKDSTLRGKDVERTISFGDIKRTFRVHLPASYNISSMYPVVIVFHGGGGDIESAVRSMGWNATADVKGFIVVYPQGTGKKALGRTFGTWNGGVCCGLAVQNKIDDVGFINAMLNALTKEWKIDQQRIYATGISNGGMMSYRLACDLSNRIAAIGPVAGQFDGGQHCVMKRPVPILHLHGLLDPCAKMEGGTCGGCFNDYLKALHIPAEKNDTWQCTAVEKTVATWAKRNGCTGTKITISNKGGVKCVSFGCSANGETELCTVDTMGHRWPGGQDDAPACTTKPRGLVCKTWNKTVGPQSNALAGNDVLWEFFKAHPM